jgi:hypothetical protein
MSEPTSFLKLLSLILAVATVDPNASAALKQVHVAGANQTTTNRKKELSLATLHQDLRVGRAPIR